MSRQAKARVVAFIPSAIADQYATLSTRYGVSKSELYRMVLQRGYRPIAAWCEQTRQTFVGDEGGSVSSATGRKGHQVASPVAQLSEFCKALVQQEPDLRVDQVRAMARAQAAVLGVSAAKSDDIVAMVIEQLFPPECNGSHDGDGFIGAVDLD